MRVDFYHLQKETLEDVLPKLLEKAISTKNNIVVRVGNEDNIELLNSLLWAYREESFLPHGSKKDGNAKLQPIWLTTENDTPNEAKFLFLVDNAKASSEDLENMDRILNIFNGNDEASLNIARAYWKDLSTQGFECHYWKQDQAGKWLQQI